MAATICHASGNPTFSAVDVNKLFRIRNTPCSAVRDFNLILNILLNKISPKGIGLKAGMLIESPLL